MAMRRGGGGHHRPPPPMVTVTTPDPFIRPEEGVGWEADGRGVYRRRRREEGEVS